jgi:hypothetical protein
MHVHGQDSLLPLFTTEMESNATFWLIVCVGKPLRDGNDDRVFLGYNIGRGSAEAMGRLLQTSRLPIVFDLDETLLVASSSSQLEQKMEDVTRRR